MQESARETVPWGPSIACSTPAAIEWVAQWKASNDPSGRLIASHNSATPAKADDGAHANGNGNGAVANGNSAVANGNGHVNGNSAVANGNGHVNGAANGKANGALE
jgi:asparagine synthase (glutamine-hydrolysing)